MYLSSFRKIPTFIMCSNQSTNKMVTYDGQFKLTICFVEMNFNVNTGNAIKNF